MWQAQAARAVGTAKNPSKPPLGTFANKGKSRLLKANQGKKNIGEKSRSPPCFLFGCQGSRI
jgi:hypothetical protein